MKIPDASHPIDIAPSGSRVRVTLDGHVIAETSHALSLREASYPAVLYVPRQDADMTTLIRTSRSTHCPYKGDASYYTISAGGRTVENAVWTYEEPYPAMAAIKDHLAFYTDKVAVDEVRGSDPGRAQA